MRLRRRENGLTWRSTLTREAAGERGIQVGRLEPGSMKPPGSGTRPPEFPWRRCRAPAWPQARVGGSTSIGSTATDRIRSDDSCAGNPRVSSIAIPTMCRRRLAPSFSTDPRKPLHGVVVIQLAQHVFGQVQALGGPLLERHIRVACEV